MGPLIIDPPHLATLDLKVSKSWVRELEMLAKKGHDVKRYLKKAQKDLADLETIKNMA